VEESNKKLVDYWLKTAEEDFKVVVYQF